jgi:uncharacterized protein (DUF1499 family)
MSVRTNTAAAAFAWTGTLIALAALAAAVLAGPGYERGWWHVSTGFTIVRWAAYAAAAAGTLALVGAVLALLTRRGRTLVAAVIGMALAFGLMAHGWELQRTAGAVPRIHDITTDTENPPRFVALLPVREQAPNGAQYGGEPVARAQKAAYPDIAPVSLDEPPPRAFERALAAAREMGWEIVAAEAAEGRIEAVATTRWFRFRDDVVIRVTPHDGGSRVDMRSMSRIGRSDLGANAARIRAYMGTLLGETDGRRRKT